MAIAIMSAMREEIDGLLRHLHLANTTRERIGDRDFYCGEVHGREVVVAFSRWGKVAAAITATELINRFQVNELWFMGVAGALDPTLHIGDIVIADGLIQHDLDARPLFKQFEIPLSGRSRLSTEPRLRAIMQSAAESFLSADFSTVISAGTRAAFRLRAPRVVVADIASGDRFIGNASEVKKLRAILPTCACVEMEGAAVAQVCVEHRLPFVVVRTISDTANEAAHIDFPRFVREIASTYSEHLIQRALSGRFGDDNG